MSEQITAIGVDGCRSGWFYARCRGGRIDVGVTTDLAALFEEQQVVRMAIDIPIGLHDVSATMRRCDRDARRLLGSRRSSVFAPPLRGALGFDRHAPASAWQKKRCGKGLSIQAFNIGHKIAEVDALLQSSPLARESMFEAHPELCFYGINNGQPIIESKKTDEGARLRMALLKKVVPDAPALLEQALATYRRKDVARDDIIDALVTLHVAKQHPAKTLSLPLEPEHDTHGLAMSITLAANDKIKARIAAALGAHPVATATRAQ